MIEIERGESRELRANLLLIGPDAESRSILPRLLARCRTPVHELCGRIDRLPACGTLVLREPAALSIKDQQALLEWLEQTDAIQVITLATAPLYPHVQKGTLLDALFYRLNILTLSTAELAGLTGIPTGPAVVPPSTSTRLRL